MRLQRPSGAMAVAFAALLAALSGTAVALPGKNSVDSGDIRNGQVRSADIRNGQVRSADIRNGGVRGKDIARDAVTGSDVKESSLGKVPTAANADSAGRATSAGSAALAGFAATAGSAQPYAYARVSGDGLVDPSLSKGISSANVTVPGLGIYCFDLPFNPKSTVATLEMQGKNDEIISALDADSPNASGGLPDCPAGTEVEVTSYDISVDGLDDDPFYIQFNP